MQLLFRRCCLALALTAALSMTSQARAQATQDALQAGFENPPNSARPRVWWHWMNGNVTREGIKLDLDWMHQVGLGGFENIDVSLGTPQVVDQRLAYMTPAWKDAFLYTTKLADSLGLKEGIASSPGWSETGGPWVKPNQAMKKYVWSETSVEGGKHLHLVLPMPPTRTGAFQDLGPEDVLGELLGVPQKMPVYYADSEVIAYREPEAEQQDAELRPHVTSSAGEVNGALLSDGFLGRTVDLPIPREGDSSWIEFAYSSPRTIRSLTIAVLRPVTEILAGPAADSGRTLEASDDGAHYHVVLELPQATTTEMTVSFAPVTARYFRVSFREPKRAPSRFSGVNMPAFLASLGITQLPPPDKNYHIAELSLHTDERVELFEEKAAFDPATNLQDRPTPVSSAVSTISPSSVIDLTSRMKPDGTLDWNPPPGRWTVLRFGYSLLGVRNHPATAEATGLEVDKLNGNDVRDYMEHYLDTYESAVGKEWMGKRGVQYLTTDSWEAGAQNWTDDMIAQFQRLRGYDPRPWMPVLTGRIVESAAASDRFLWDFRETIADLTAEEHYGQIERSLKERGMGHYGESHESGRAMIADGMEVKKDDDIPMGAMWTQTPGVNKELYGYDADDRESASVAHIYGQNLAAAESMTADLAPWAWSPATLKPTADAEMVNGINRFVIHCSVHQPLVDKAPGLSLGPFGQWFTRNETWGEQAGPWVSYLSRSSYLLQQGVYSADLLYFYGEDTNLTAVFANSAPDLPPGYGFDYVNADALEHMFTVSNGRIVTKSGMSYRAIVLDPDTAHMSLPVLRSLRDLVRAGATVIGARPADTPSLADDVHAFVAMRNELWGDGDQTGAHRLGAGTVYGGTSVAQALRSMNVTPDFDAGEGKGIRFVHRSLPGAEIYFLDNRSDSAQDFTASFRVTGRAAEFWHADTGKIEPASYTMAAGSTEVPLHLDPWETVFLVFRQKTATRSRTIPQPALRQLTRIEGPWKLAFESGRGAPATAEMPQLTSWTSNADAGIRYFSGTATYTRTVDVPATWLAHGAKLWLDLGDVKDLASVTVNGKPAGQVWHAPWRIEIAELLKPGQNQIAIAVTNLWVNRMIGDAQPGAKPYTFETYHPYRADSPLLPSGLLGPVILDVAQ